jgi:hypothetical protein
MKEQIERVQDYFKNKLLSNEFVIVKIDQYQLEILIDDHFNFTLWIGNFDLPCTLKNNTLSQSFMDLKLTDENSEDLHAILYPTIMKHRQEVLIAKKIEELEDLKKSLL